RNHIYTLSLHDALPIFRNKQGRAGWRRRGAINIECRKSIAIQILAKKIACWRQLSVLEVPRLVVTQQQVGVAHTIDLHKNIFGRSEEHTSELQSRGHLV